MTQLEQEEFSWQTVKLLMKSLKNQFINTKAAKERKKRRA